MELAIWCDVSPPTAEVGVRGDLDVFGATALGRRIGAAVAGGAREVLLDLAGTTFVDAAALSQLSRVLAMVRAHDGELRLVASSAPFRLVCGMTRRLDAALLLP